MISLFLWGLCCLYQAFSGEVIIKDTDSMSIALICELAFEFLIVLFNVKIPD